MVKIFLIIFLFISHDAIASDRDSRLLEILNNADKSNISEAQVFIVTLKHKKLRGYKVGGSIWNNEQWANIIAVKNDTNFKRSGTIYLRVFDEDGFLLDSYLLFAGKIGPQETKKVSKHLFVKLAYIDQIASSSLEANFITKR